MYDCRTGGRAQTGLCGTATLSQTSLALQTQLNCLLDEREFTITLARCVVRLGEKLLDRQSGQHGLQDAAMMSSRLMAKLAVNLTHERATDHVWTLTAPELADRLVRRCGWPLDEYQRWLGTQLIAGLTPVGQPDR